MHSSLGHSAWVTVDEVYGQNPTFREWLATQGVPFVLATHSNDTVPAVGGRPRLARSLASQVPAGAWERRSAGTERTAPGCSN